MVDLQIDVRADFGLVSIMAGKGVGADRIGAALGIAAPTAPGRAIGPGGLSLIGTGPGSWLAHADGTSAFWAETLRAQLRGLAAVSDQSGGYAIHRLSGARARTILQRGMAIDLHPDVFGLGAAVTTVIAHIGAIVWQGDDLETFDVATFRSYSDSFRHWLDQAALAH